MKPSEPKLPKRILVELDAVVGPQGYSVSSTDRASYARDANFRSAIESHYGKFPPLPSVVVWPKTAIQLSHIIKIAARNHVALIPYGGGSGVCRGAQSENGGIIVDVKRMNRVLRLDEDKLFCDAETGIYGWHFENHLERKGFTLGHFPSSIPVATLGGYLAARSAGQLSSKYGKIEDMIIDLEFVDGSGRVHRTTDISRKFGGLDFTQAIVGSEGALGFITRARLKIWPKPQTRIFQSFRFPRISYGLEAMRRIMQSGVSPDVLRLYDELDSLLMFSKTKSDHDPLSFLKPFLPQSLDNAVSSLKSRAQSLAIRAHRLINVAAPLVRSGNLLVVMTQGAPALARTTADLVATICKQLDGQDTGKEPAEYWHEHRYSVAFKASKLFRHGAFTDTMETATTWDNLGNLYESVRSRAGKHALVLAHISHVYADGAAIYFTFVTPMTGLKSSVSDYDKLWNEALTAVQDASGVLSHHHGIGRLKKEHLVSDWGTAAEIYKKLKSFFDPHGILNPGVLADVEIAGKNKRKAS